MAYDMDRCPQTDAEMCEYFYTLIGRRLGERADDYEAVLMKAYPWKGQHLMIPPGVGPGITQPADAPFYGLTQQFSGVPKCRVFLPTDQPDENGYFTRCDQYVDDDPGGQGGLVWAWYLAGPENAYAPVMGADGDGGSSGGDGGSSSGGGLTEAQVQAMIDASLAPLQAQLADAVKLGDKIALRTNSGMIAGIAGGGPTAEDAPIDLIGKIEIHAWESFTLERGE